MQGTTDDQSASVSIPAVLVGQRETHKVPQNNNQPLKRNSIHGNNCILWRYIISHLHRIHKTPKSRQTNISDYQLDISGEYTTGYISSDSQKCSIKCVTMLHMFHISLQTVSSLSRFGTFVIMFADDTLLKTAENCHFLCKKKKQDIFCIINLICLKFAFKWCWESSGSFIWMFSNNHSWVLKFNELNLLTNSTLAVMVAVRPRGHKFWAADLWCHMDPRSYRNTKSVIYTWSVFSSHIH